jgi:hypothetical protein
MLRSIACRLALLWLIPFGVHAQSASDAAIPPVLKDWRSWVLQDHAFRACPFLGTVRPDSPDTFICAWPSRLAINATSDAAAFTIHWQISAPAWVPLPGDSEHWPQQVTVNNQRQPVVAHDQFPALYLQPGSYEVAGKFAWRSRPQNLRVPHGIGLVALTIDGKAIAPLQRSQDVVTLGRGNVGTPESDAMQIRVFRDVIDGIPARLDTQIQFAVSGQAREEVLGPVLPDGFVPLAMTGDWPARLDDDGKLHVQVQAGNDTIILHARATAPLTRITARVPAAPWPQQETWSYAADPTLRVTAASSALQVDPRQAGVPNEWNAQPAFVLGNDGVLAIEQRSRGLSADEGNQLTLQREAWLSFDGGGWFARDHVGGTMVRGWRLDVAAPYLLERADAQNSRSGPSGGAEPLLITQGAKPGLSGVEWRTPTVDLAAGVRVSGASSLPVTGWQDTFDRIDTTLHLPYGYRLLAVPGADSASGSWMSAWTLLDAFVCAILVLLAWRYLGVLGGAATALYLLLAYQEIDSPFWSLLWVAGLALIARELPSGRLRAWTEGFRRAGLLVLILIALPFVADQLRFALYPQLEGGGSSVSFYVGGARHKVADMQRRDEMVANQPMEEQSLQTPPPPPAPPSRAAESKPETIVVTASKVDRADLIDHYSESTVVQTGRGEPHWTLGSTASLSWSGPVLAEQTMHLLIAPPWLVCPLRVLLVLLLGWLMWRFSRSTIDTMRKRLPLSSAALLVSGLLIAAPLQAQTIPSDELLNQLQKRLTEAPKCAPNCVGIAEALVGANGDGIDVVLDAQAIEASALPLPVADASLVLKSVKVDGADNDAVVEHSDMLWVGMPRGVHRVELNYSAFADKASLRFPLLPGRVQFNLSGWEGSGVADDHLLADTLNLTRTHANAGEKIMAGAQQFPAYVRVNRTLQLGLQWSSYTNVQKLAPENGGITVTIPLMSNEHVASQTKTEGRNAVVAIGDDGQATWSSTLDIGDTLSLTAPPLTERAEIWRIVVSPTWHIEFSGVPETGGAYAVDPSEANDYRQFVFAPLPGETLTVKVTRPTPVQGATRAIDSATLHSEQGQHASTHTLHLQMRASQGGDQLVTLPHDVDVLGVSRNGQPLNLRPQDGKLTLPLTPGAQTFEVRFRQTAELSSVAHTPDMALGLPAANIDVSLTLPADRWLLATWGPRAGPAVLYWGELSVMVLVAYALSRTRRTKLRFVDWLLLGFGFSTFSWGALVVVVAWLFAFDWRSRNTPAADRTFNLAQFALAALTVVALLCLISAIPQGLLGQPDMHVSGYASDAHSLHWFVDRSEDALPHATAISIPMWVYKVLMLLWALWLANALIGWLRDAFAAWTRGGYWRLRAKPTPPTAAP